MKIQETLVEFMKEQAYKPMNLKELAKVFNIKSDDIEDFKKVLDYMEKDGLVVKTRTEHYGVPEKMGLLVGKVQGHKRGYAFLIPEDDREDVFIPASGLNGAMNGDKVVVKVFKEIKEGKRSEGEVIRILD
ncbi:ribonuclease R, partial [Coprococcus sp. MSK.21.13]|nr:ribonuclease R [Coprococcus sp. MSK.21.13]